MPAIFSMLSKNESSVQQMWILVMRPNRTNNEKCKDHFDLCNHYLTAATTAPENRRRTKNNFQHSTWISNETWIAPLPSLVSLGAPTHNFAYMRNEMQSTHTNTYTKDQRQMTKNYFCWNINSKWSVTFTITCEAAAAVVVVVIADIQSLAIVAVVHWLIH